MLSVGACITQGPPPYPLYPNAGQPRPDDQVGVLSGPFAVIDGQEVANKGQVFALLPGCHTLRLVQTTGEVNPGGAYVTRLPQQTLSFQVEAGHRYFFETTMYGSSGGPVTTGTMAIFDHHPDGSATAALGCGASSTPVPPPAPGP